jgi:hypothetical protein
MKKDGKLPSFFSGRNAHAVPTFNATRAAFADTRSGKPDQRL